MDVFDPGCSADRDRLYHRLQFYPKCVQNRESVGSMAVASHGCSKRDGDDLRDWEERRWWIVFTSTLKFRSACMTSINICTSLLGIIMARNPLSTQQPPIGQANSVLERSLRKHITGIIPWSRPMVHFRRPSPSPRTHSLQSPYSPNKL